MAEKLKSILKRTSWSLLLRAVVFAVAWWALPFWLFLLIALYLYFVPIGGARKVAAPFFVLLLLCLATAPDIFAIVLFGAIFYFVLLIKDLLIIDRRSAYEILVLVLSYLTVRGLFVAVGGSLGGHALLYSLIAAAAVSIMVASFIKNFTVVPEGALREATSFRHVIGWMSFLFAWQLCIVGLFLPLDFLYQSAVIFLLLAVLIDLVPQYVFGELSRTKMLATGMVILGLLVIVLTSARWIL